MEILVYGAALPTAMGLGWMLFLYVRLLEASEPELLLSIFPIWAWRPPEHLPHMAGVLMARRLPRAPRTPSESPTRSLLDHAPLPC